MWNPVHIDGNSVVWIVQKGTIGEYVASESGILEYDGETLYVLHADGSRRDIDDDERDKLLPVSNNNTIQACDRFDLFHVLPRPVQPGFLRTCPECRRWFALSFVRSVPDDQQGSLKTYRCKRCKTEFTFASRHPDGTI